MRENYEEERERERPCACASERACVCEVQTGVNTSISEGSDGG